MPQIAEGVVVELRPRPTLAPGFQLPIAPILIGAASVSQQTVLVVIGTGFGGAGRAAAQAVAVGVVVIAGMGLAVAGDGLEVTGLVIVIDPTTSTTWTPTFLS